MLPSFTRRSIKSMCQFSGPSTPPKPLIPPALGPYHPISRVICPAFQPNYAVPVQQTKRQMPQRRKNKVISDDFIVSDVILSEAIINNNITTFSEGVSSHFSSCYRFIIWQSKLKVCLGTCESSDPSVPQLEHLRRNKRMRVRPAITVPPPAPAKVRLTRGGGGNPI